MTAMRPAGLTVALAFLLAAACPAQSDNYTHALRRTILLSNRPNVKLLPLGRSPQNRAIPALAIADFRSHPNDKLRILVCAGQHGDEPNPVTAALDLGAKVAGQPDILSRCVFVIVPMANPDGLAAARRTNSHGVDINRDWAVRRTVEAQFVHALVKSWRPQLLFDLHEWPDAPAGPANTIEACAHGPGRLAASACHASGLALVGPPPGSSTNLFDRYYARRGYAAYMIETGPGVRPDAKSRAYQTAVLAAVASACSGGVDVAALSPSAGGLPAQVASTYFGAASRPAADQPVRTAAIVIAAYCLALLAGRRFTKPERLSWSRRYTRCELPEGVAPDSSRKGALVPLTARSWTRRRTRTRFTGFPATLGQITPTGTIRPSSGSPAEGRSVASRSARV